MARRYGFLAGCAALALAAPAAALADAEHDSVTGGGISSVETRFGFTAQNTPGAGALGYASFKNFLGTNTDRSGRVTCLRVEGNEAVFGIVDRAADGTIVYRQFYVQDNGEPVDGVAVDELHEVGSGSPVELACADPTQQSSAGFVIREGNIVVRDA